jgi:hypothetical protein
MPRNYDTTSKRPYPRVTRIEIDYSPDGVPRIDYVEQVAIVDADRQVRHLALAPTRHTLDLSTVTEPVQIIHPATGEPIPGQTVTSQQLMLGLLAFLRADQKRRDAEADDAAGTT